MLAWVGTYTRESSAGIYAFRFDPDSGAAEPLGLAAELRDPSFLAVHPAGRYLYAVSETDDFDEQGSGSVLSFEIHYGSGRLRRLNEVSSKGGWPCHLSVDPSGRTVIAANYKGGSVSSFPLLADGRLGQAVSFFRHAGQSIHPRQQQPHAHSADFSADGRFAFVSDLGLDQIRIYRSDVAQSVIEPHEPASASVSPGSGPRHISQHPSGRFLYGLNELSSTVSVFRYENDPGTLTHLQTASALPAGFEGESYAAEIAIHPSGTLLYASNRGHDSLAVFSVDPENGLLTASGHALTLGEWPRSFGLDPSGRFLWALNQRSDSIVIFRIDPVTGALEPTDVQLEIDAPACVVFQPR